jgi:hypothetical protein
MAINWQHKFHPKPQIAAIPYISMVHPTGIEPVSTVPEAVQSIIP